MLRVIVNALAFSSSVELTPDTRRGSASISNQSRQAMSASAVALLGFDISLSLCSLL
jgi:hypothetical protein